MTTKSNGENIKEVKEEIEELRLIIFQKPSLAKISVANNTWRGVNNFLQSPSIMGVPISNIFESENLGNGKKIFKESSENKLFFRTIDSNSQILTITENTDDISLYLNAGDTGTNNIVTRDNSGNFTAGTITANITGSSSNNILKSGGYYGG